jgi:predicted RNA-binding Zn ribbon-like protein
MTVMPTDQTAPAELELVRQFVNTLDVEEHTDALATPEGAVRWLAAHGIDGGERSISGADRERLVEVREALRGLLLANNSGSTPPAECLETLNEQSAEAAVVLRFDPSGAALVTRCGGVDSAIARLLAIVHAAMNDRTWPRLKACPADDCMWAFYDHSRNRSGTWCEMGECGNRAKARRWRERHKPSPA